MGLEAGAEFFFLLNQDAWIDKDTMGELRKAADENTSFGILSPVHLNGTGNFR